MPRLRAIFSMNSKVFCVKSSTKKNPGKKTRKMRQKIISCGQRRTETSKVKISSVNE